MFFKNLLRHIFADFVVLIRDYTVGCEVGFIDPTACVTHLANHPKRVKVLLLFLSMICQLHALYIEFCDYAMCV